MKRYKTLFTELEHSEEYYQRAFDLIDILKKDTDLKQKAMVMLRDIEQKTKKYIRDHYKNEEDIKNFSEILQTTATNELVKKPEISHVYLTLMLITSYKLKSGPEKDQGKAAEEKPQQTTPAATAPVTPPAQKT